MYLSARRLFTGRTKELLEDRVVEIEDGRIATIRPRASLPLSAEVVDLGDATLLPGLIDVHQHLAFDASTGPVARLDADEDGALLLRMRLAAQRALAVGVTTIRDLGDRNYLSLTLRDWFLDGNEVGPRIVASGPPITSPRGHCWFLGGEAEGADGVRRAVRARVARGVDVIKVMVSGGNMTPRPSDGTSPSSYVSSSPSRWRRRTPLGCRWPCTRTAAKRWRTRSPSVRTPSSTAPSSAPTVSTPTLRSSDSWPPAVA